MKNTISAKIPIEKNPKKSVPAGKELMPRDNSNHGVTFSSWRIRWGLSLSMVGMFLFLLGTAPNLFGVDRSPIIGFVQLSFFVIGLGVLYLGGFTALKAFWKNRKSSIASEFGGRFIATGYVISVFAGLADIIGIGSQGFPLIYFGPLQSFGVLLGQGLSAIGLMMLIPFSVDLLRSRVTP
jgi:hypothetical protein